MRVAEWVNLFFFSFFMVLAWLRPSVRRRRGVAIVGFTGVGLVLATIFLPALLPPLAVSVIRDWLPAPLILMVYWQAGLFFEKPNKKFQAKLQRFDRELMNAVSWCRANQSSGTWVARYLELAYLFCYPLVPLGVGVLYVTQLGHYVDQYWAIVLPPTYLCYVMLPFLQTLPPRMLAPEQPSLGNRPGIRGLNLWILRHASIGVNTFPSAHVAATIAASLALLRFVPPLGVLFLWVSISIAVSKIYEPIRPKGQKTMPISVLAQQP